VLTNLPVKGCINYIVADDRFNEDVMYPELFEVENTFTVGRAFKNSYYNPEWEKYPPDLTIYDNFVRDWKRRYPKYNEIRLNAYSLTPFLIRRNGVCFSPPANSLILDSIIDEEILEVMLNCGAKNCIFANNPVIQSTSHFELLLRTYKSKVYRGGDFKVEIDWTQEFKDNMNTYMELWAEYSCGRMFVIRIRIDAITATRQDKIDIYNTLGRWRLEVGKRLAVYAANPMDDYRFWTEIKRWSSSRAGYSKNSLIDYIIYDACRNIKTIAYFLDEPEEYILREKMGTNKLWWVVDLFKSGDDELIRTLTTSYDKGGF
jgi:hypothetical protein